MREKKRIWAKQIPPQKMGKTSARIALNFMFWMWARRERREHRCCIWKNWSVICRLRPKICRCLNPHLIQLFNKLQLLFICLIVSTLFQLFYLLYSIIQAFFFPSCTTKHINIVITSWKPRTVKRLHLMEAEALCICNKWPEKNHTSLWELVLLGLADTLELQVILFCIFLWFKRLRLWGMLGRFS